MNQESEVEWNQSVLIVLIEDSPSRDQLQNGRRKFKEEWRKELTWLKFNRTTGITVCEQWAYLPSIEDHSSNTVEGFSGSLKLETFKKVEKSFQHQKCVMVYSALLAPKDTSLAVCMTKMDKKYLIV
jgi:hypothetical protein